MTIGAAIALVGAGCSGTTKVETNLESTDTKTSVEVSTTSSASNSESNKVGSETTTPPADTAPDKSGATVNVGVSTTVDVKVPKPVVPAATVKAFIVTGSNFTFDKTSLTVKKGDVVKITFVNAEGFHDWRIDEFNVATDKLSAGAQATVQFTASKTGSFEYYCSVGTHRAMGMKGTLTVE